jgi:hypothetical protein
VIRVTQQNLLPSDNHLRRRRRLLNNLNRHHLQPLSIQSLMDFVADQHST